MYCLAVYRSSFLAATAVRRVGEERVVEELYKDAQELLAICPVSGREARGTLWRWGWSPHVS